LLTNEKDEAGAIKISSRGKGSFVSAKAFLDFYNIKYPRKEKYDIKYDEEHKLYFVELTN